MTNEVDRTGIEKALRRIARRAFAIEQRLARSERKGKDFWDIAAVFLPIIQAVILAVVGIYFTERVNQTLRQRELELSNVKEMRETLLKLYAPNVDATESTAAALSLTAFRGYAVPSLVFALEAGANQNVVAERSLRSLGTSEPELVCAPVVRILHNRSQGHSIEALLSAVRLARTVECEKAFPELANLQGIIGQGTPVEALGRLKGIVSQPSPTAQNVADLREEISIALEGLRAPGSTP